MRAREYARPTGKLFRTADIQALKNGNAVILIEEWSGLEHDYFQILNSKSKTATDPIPLKDIRKNKWGKNAGMAVLKNQNKIIFASGNGLQCWEAKDDTFILKDTVEVKEDLTDIHALADEKHLLITHDYQAMSIWDISGECKDWKKVADIPIKKHYKIAEYTGSQLSVTTTPDSNRMILSHNHYMTTWDISDKTAPKFFSEVNVESKEVINFSFKTTADSRYLLCHYKPERPNTESGPTGFLRMWDISEEKSAKVVSTVPTKYYCFHELFPADNFLDLEKRKMVAKTLTVFHPGIQKIINEYDSPTFFITFAEPNSTRKKTMTLWDFSNLNEPRIINEITLKGNNYNFYQTNDLLIYFGHSRTLNFVNKSELNQPNEKVSKKFKNAKTVKLNGVKEFKVEMDEPAVVQQGFFAKKSTGSTLSGFMLDLKNWVKKKYNSSLRSMVVFMTKNH